MTDDTRSIWRGAFDLYEWNHWMPNTDDSWKAFITSVTAFAEAHDWRTNPLTRCLAMAIIEAVEGEIKDRALLDLQVKETAQQLSFLTEEAKKI